MKPPNPIGPLLLAAVSSFAFVGLMSGGGSGARGVVNFILCVGVVGLSTYWNIRTKKRLAGHAVASAHAWRWIALTLAFVLNGFVYVIGTMLIVLLVGSLLSGHAPVG